MNVSVPHPSTQLSLPKILITVAPELVTSISRSLFAFIAQPVVGAGFGVAVACGATVGLGVAVGVGVATGVAVGVGVGVVHTTLKFIASLIAEDTPLIVCFA